MHDREEVYNRYCQDGARRRTVAVLLMLSLLVFFSISTLFDNPPFHRGSHIGSRLTRLLTYAVCKHHLHAETLACTHAQANLTFHFTADETRITCDTQLHHFINLDPRPFSQIHPSKHIGSADI